MNLQLRDVGEVGFPQSVQPLRELLFGSAHPVERRRLGRQPLPLANDIVLRAGENELLVDVLRLAGELFYVDVFDVNVELPFRMATQDVVDIGHAGNALTGERRPLPGADVELLQLLPSKIGDAALTDLR